MCVCALYSNGVDLYAGIIPSRVFLIQWILAVLIPEEILNVYIGHYVGLSTEDS